jgi:hypothetical protein
MNKIVINTCSLEEAMSATASSTMTTIAAIIIIITIVHCRRRRKRGSRSMPTLNAIATIQE